MKKFDIVTTSNSVPILTYSYSKELDIGSIVHVPLRNKTLLGIVIRRNDDLSDSVKLKEIIRIFNEFKISDGLLKFCDFFAKYYLADMASIVKMILPVKFKDEIKVRSIEQNIIFNLPSLSPAQELAYNAIKNTSKVSVLHGVTGSGKTEVYFHLIADHLRDGKQILLMLPEISLTQQIAERLKKAFGCDPIIWHSGVSPAKKRDIFFGVTSASVKIIIGTRSSLFLPFKNLGIIIVDEEHDSSYKQEEQTLYNARDAAVLRASLEGVKIVLASATPSIETYYNSVEGKYDLVKLSERYGPAVMPKIHVINMRNQPRGKWISKELEVAIKNALEDKHQAILFINRRGYAPLMLCVSCGYRFSCNNCSSWLVYHKNANSLVCHHCGYTEDKKDKCPDCDSNNLIAYGPGVERIGDEISQLFPFAKLALFTKVNVESEAALADLIKSIENRDVDIIVGTQIVTKGFHFPYVSVVGIIDADSGLSNIDLKASERCFQLLSQISGRAGRSRTEGAAFFQTYYQDTKLFEHIQNDDQESFYKEEIESRVKSSLPPITRIVALIISSDNENLALHEAKKIRNLSPKVNRVNILGPAPATMSKLRGKFRFRILYISDKKYDIQKYIDTLLAKIKPHSSVYIRAEIDPQSFY